MREALENRSFDYDPSMWESASGMLDAHYRKLRLKKMLSIAASAAAVAVAVGIWLFADPPKTPETGNPSANVVQPGSTLLEESSTNSLSTTRGNAAIPMSETENANSGQTSGLGVATSETEEKADFPAKPEEGLASVENNPIETEPIEETHTTSYSNTASNAQVLSQESPLGTLPHSNAGTGQLAEAAPSGSDIPLMFDMDMQLEDVAEPKNQHDVPPSMVTRTLEIKASVLPMPAFSVKQLSGLAFQPLAHKNSHDSIARLARKEAQKVTRQFSVDFVGGVQVSQGFKNNMSKRDGLSLDPFGGITFGLHLSKGPSLFLGLIGSRRGKLAASRGFVSEQGGVHTITSKTLTYLELPILVQFRLHARHSLAFGMKYAHLLGATIEETDSQTTSNGWGKEGFSENDVAVIAGYEFAVAKHLSLVPQLHVGFFDITDNGVFRSGDVTDRNLQFRIGIKYDLLNR